MRSSTGAGKPETLSEAVYRQIRRDILSGLLAPGQRLALSALRERHAASFGVVREALSRLAGERLVQATPQLGFRVHAPSPAGLRDMIAIYRRIERMAVRRAFACGDVAWEARVLAAGHTLVRTSAQAPADPEQAFADMQAAYHTALLGACDSPCLLELWRSLYDALAAHRRAGIRTAVQRAEIGDRYQAVTHAVLDRDIASAMERLAQCDPSPADEAGA
ncbi:GntR family transcriptional regulator [Reyranella sp. CPCC 100927]|uniref:GntR family transcriptional regulator n=1 Tax=Reyranella sp. CPCC 100927 TaxID=2599616 RepID=UPI0015B7637F|nr:GntR family transcriptional regulator [Reyranella sp. CPCC 100927]